MASGTVTVSDSPVATVAVSDDLADRLGSFSDDFSFDFDISGQMTVDIADTSVS